MGSRVLLADDSVTIQKVVGIIFANEGYELTTVATGDDAISRAKELKPDVMLVDALMPGKNGYEVCREIRQNPGLSHVAILLMTGAFEVVDEEKNRASGADEFITKPFESQSLIDATNRMIALTAQRAASPSTPAAPVAAAPAAPSVDDVWATGFDMEPAAEMASEPVFEAAPPSPAEVVPVKAALDDDLWGAFDMDAIETTPLPLEVPAPVTVAQNDDFFSFEAETPKPVVLPAEDEFILDEVAAEAPPTATGFEPVGEEEISFEDVAPAPFEEPLKTDYQAEDDFSAISFDDEPPAPILDVAPVAPLLAPVAAPPAAPVVPQVAEFSTAPAAPPAVSPAALDEAQIKTIIAGLSREVIERIVWEVVPDLAEMIIKEEIKKLKAGIA